MGEEWRTYKKERGERIEKTLADEIHEFLTKVFNVYYVQLPPALYKLLDTVRDRLIPLTVKFDQGRYNEFCQTFRTVYRAIISDQSVPGDAKKLVKELVDRTNEFFQSKGFPRCVEELKYHRVRVKVRFRGRPLEKAIVSADAQGRSVATKETGDEGVAVLDLPAGKYTLSVFKHVGEEEYVYEERDVEVDKDQDLVFEIERTKTLAQIHRERRGRPIIKEV